MKAPPVPAPASGARTGGSRRSVPAPLLGVIGILGFLLLWEVVVRTGAVEARFLPPASSVIATLGELTTRGDFWSAVGKTMMTWAIGLGIAGTGAIVLGLVIGSRPFFRKLTHSTIEFLRPIPSVALIPIAVLLFGTSMESTLLLVVYAAFWQVLIQVLYGVGDVDPVAADTARSYGLGAVDRVRWLIWPTALPYVMTGLRLGAAVALILTVTGELVIGGGGIGTMIALSQSGGAVPQLYALVVVSGLLGVLINLGARLVERRALAWHVSVRRDAEL